MNKLYKILTKNLLMFLEAIGFIAVIGFVLFIVWLITLMFTNGGIC